MDEPKRIPATLETENGEKVTEGLCILFDETSGHFEPGFRQPYPELDKSIVYTIRQSTGEILRAKNIYKCPAINGGHYHFLPIKESVS